MSNYSDHYDADYFDWQRKIGMFGGKANSFRFQKSIKKSDTVIDFGCGGGFLLSNLICNKKFGIEPNISCRDQLKLNNIEAYFSPQEMLEAKGSNFADVIISNNALEHTLNPFLELKALHSLLKKGGVIHFAVPCDSFKLKYKPNNRDYHLYSWSPMNIGNLFNEAGFKVYKANLAKLQRWPPFYKKLQKLFGWKGFFFCCSVFSILESSWKQIEIIAQK